MRYVDQLANVNAFVRNFDNLLFTALSLLFFGKFGHADLVSLLAMIITTAGLIIWWMAKLTLGKYYTLTPQFQALVTRGIYSKIRHPIYVGSCFVYIGWITLTQSLLISVIAVLMIIVQMIRMISEEKLLLKELGRTYLEYKRSTWF